jgi:predicted  nucleic acid-binding Zn-ribbon protein
MLAVPRFEDDKLAASSLILADQLEPVPIKQIGTGQFVLGSSKVRPRLSGEFSVEDKMGIYMQVYNLKVDETTHKAKASIEYHVRKNDQEVWGATENTEQMKQNGEQITIERLLPLSALGPGKYKLQINATDQLANQSISRSMDFSVKAAAEVKAAANAAPGR